MGAGVLALSLGGVAGVGMVLVAAKTSPLLALAAVIGAVMLIKGRKARKTPERKA